MAKWYGISFPFYRGNSLLGSSSQVLPRQEDNRLIKNDLIQGLMTNKGERAFRPGFGGDVSRYLFEQNDATSRNQIKTSIMDQIGTFHPRVIVSEIDVRESSDNSNVMVVTVMGRTDLEATNVDDVLARFMLPVSGTISNAKNLIGGR